MLRSGENVQPVPLEARLHTSPYIEEVMLVGQDEKHLGALIVPALDALRAAGLTRAASLVEAAADPAVERVIEGELDRLLPLGDFRAWERIPAFRLLPHRFQVGEELSPTLKLRRHVVGERYREEIRSLFPVRSPLGINTSASPRRSPPPTQGGPPTGS